MGLNADRQPHGARRGVDLRLHGEAPVGWLDGQVAGMGDEVLAVHFNWSAT